MDRDHEQRAPTVAAVLFVLVALGCGAAPTATPLPSTALAQPAALECETESFPCVFADVPANVRAETERLADEAVRLVNDGASNDELVAWLDSEESVAEVEGDSDAVRFRPVGGRGVWIIRGAPLAPSSRGLAADALA
ncbi:MAG: hypothetical protein WD830_11930 [Chloroflexota bacterium]